MFSGGPEGRAAFGARIGKGSLEHPAQSGYATSMQPIDLNVAPLHSLARRGILCFVALTSLLLGQSLPAASLERKPIDQLPHVKELPDPFLMADGSRVKSREDWARRRKELIDLILAYEYGALPPAMASVKATVTTARPTTRPADMPGATESDVLLAMGPGDRVTIHLHLFIPASPAGDSGKYPIIVRGDRDKGSVNPEIAAAVVKRGYILAEFDRTELFADQKDIRTGGINAAWPDYAGSALGAWAWGYHRVVDYLLTRPDIDPRCIAITGHSRGGKAVLLAGALDERISLVAPNDSGCGGCGCYRFQAAKSETIENIVVRFPYWFEPRFPEFIGHVDQLPFDQHSVKALVAPRALLETSALNDAWSNPEGSQQTWIAAREVFAFLSVPEQIGIASRPGKHGHNPIDWTALLDFADWRFYGKKSDRAFDTLAFPESEKRYSWGKP